MLLSKFITQVIDTAKAGQAPDGQVALSRMESEVETLSNQALNDLAVATAKDTKRRYRLSKVFSLTVNTEANVGQYADIDEAMLTGYLPCGSVRVADFANNGLGTELVPVSHYEDFIGPLPAAFGYYCLHRNRIYTRALGSGSFFDTPGPLTVDCSYVPTLAQTPLELEEDLVKIAAARLTGLLKT